MRRFGTFDSAARFCAHGAPVSAEQRSYFCVRMKMRECASPLAEQRREYCAHWTALRDELMAA